MGWCKVRVLGVLGYHERVYKILQWLGSLESIIMDLLKVAIDHVGTTFLSLNRIASAKTVVNG